MSPPVRILHCHSAFNLGGKEARAVRLMNAMGARATHTILSAQPEALNARKAIDSGVRVDFPLEGRAPPLHGKPAPGRYLALARYFQNFDLVLSYNWGSMDAVMAHRLLSRLMPLPPLIHHEDGFNEDESEKRDWRRNAFRRAGLPTARAVVVPSHVLEVIARREWGVRRIVRIANGIALDAYRTPPVPGSIAGFEKRKGHLVVGTIAGLRAVKDLPLLVEAVARCTTPVQLVIVGEGPERDVIAARAAALGVADRVHLAGFLPQPHRYVGHFDVIALSSRTEQQPIAVIEGMAAGLPVVAPSVGDIPRMVSPQNATAIVGRDAEELAAAMDAFARDAVRRRQVGRANATKAQAEFSETAMLTPYDRLYADAVGVERLIG
jgi:L-malate glycosyltransferase